MNDVAQSSAPAWSEQLAAQSFTTPSYVYCVDEMTRQFNAAKEALGTPLLVTVAACPNPDILGRLPTGTCIGALSASKTEMSIVSAWKTDYSFVKIAALDTIAARAVLGGKYRLIIDQAEHISLLAQVRGKRVVTPISLCVNIGVVDQFGADSALAPQLAGMDKPQLDLALALAQEHQIPIGGLQIHAGPGNFASHACALAQSLPALIAYIEQKLGQPLQTVVLGAALPNDWQQQDLGAQFARYRELLKAVPSHIELMHDIGRSVMGSSGIFAAKVISQKTIFGQTIALCDGGMVQAFLLSEAAQGQRLSSICQIKRNGQLLPTTPVSTGGTLLVGPSGHEQDVLARIAQTLEVGDVLFFSNAGAYVQAYTPSQYLGFHPVSALIV